MENSEGGAAGDLMSFWLQFFQDAGIVASDIENYSVTFVNHRIQKSMLKDINKEYLVDMGITAMGDIIAILKQAKGHQTEPFCGMTRAMEPTSTAASSKEKPLTPLAKLEKSLSSDLRCHRSTPASRMVDHYLANEPGARLMRDSEPLGSPDQGRCVGSVNRKSSVFNRLGSNTSQAKALPGQSRLSFQEKGTPSYEVTVGKKADLREVLKRPATTTCLNTDDSDSDGSECRYAGVLKKQNAPNKRRKRYVSTSNCQSSSASDIQTAGIFGANAIIRSTSAKERLGQMKRPGRKRRKNQS